MTKETGPVQLVILVLCRISDTLATGVRGLRSSAAPDVVPPQFPERHVIFPQERPESRLARKHNQSQLTIRERLASISSLPLLECRISWWFRSRRPRKPAPPCYIRTE